MTMAHYSECTCTEDFLAYDPAGHEEGCPCLVDDDNASDGEIMAHIDLTPQGENQ